MTLLLQLAYLLPQDILFILLCPFPDLQAEKYALDAALPWARAIFPQQTLPIVIV